jgi:hypothetical protein
MLENIAPGFVVTHAKGLKESDVITLKRVACDVPWYPGRIEIVGLLGASVIRNSFQYPASGKLC